jgi:hypothetical protein
MTRAITDDGDLCAGGDTMNEWDQYLLYLANVKESKSCEIPMGLEQWLAWKREQEKVAGE